MRLLLLFLGLSIISLSFAQKYPKEDFIPLMVDSVYFNVEKNRTKEMLLPGQEEISEQIGEVTLSTKEIQEFLKKLRKPSSYDHGRALLGHHNLTFKAYYEGIRCITIYISTLTRNIDIYTKKHVGFNGKISKKFGNYLIKLLKYHQLFKPLEEIGDLEGVL